MARDDRTTVKKPKTAKGKRVLEKRAPKEVEDAKHILVMQGNKVSQVVKDVLLDILKLKKGQAYKMTRKNEVWPFEAGHETTLQFYCERSDCALFCLGNHNKKRPHNLVLGRMFNAQLLDMVEFGVIKHAPITSFPSAKHIQVGTKSCFLFIGEAFERDARFSLAKSLLLDTLRGEEVDEINLMSISHVIVCTAVDGDALKFRHYAIRLKKSGTRIPRVELEESGPLLDLSIRRTRHAPPDLQKEALTHLKLGKKMQKNTAFEQLEGKVGRIYMPAQDLSTVALAKGKGTKRVRRDAAAERKHRKVLDGSTVGAASEDSSGDDHALALPSRPRPVSL